MRTAGMLAVAAVLFCGLAGCARTMTYANSLSIPGDATDLSGDEHNRLGAIGSGLAYDRTSNVYYALVDRGSSGGVLDFPTRMHKFSLDVDHATGAISNFRLLETIRFKTKDGATLMGCTPCLANTLGLSFDPEGIALAPNGHVFVADEYGPSIYEFQLVPAAGGGTEARMVRSLRVPANLVPKDATGNPDYSNSPVTGRQDNRGYEGLTISGDGTKLYAVLQGPLAEEGDHPTAALPLGNGRYSRNVRIVEFDTATGQNTAQYIYQLESLSTINQRLPASQAYASREQGQKIGVSDILWVGTNRLWVIERDDRGITDDDPLGKRPVSTKRLYEVDLSSATDVKNTSLAGTLSLPPRVRAADKRLVLDLRAFLAAAGLPVVEKYESMVLGPRLNNGRHLLLIGSDNDMSMTRDATRKVPLDIWVNPALGQVRYTPFGNRSQSHESSELTRDLGPLPRGFSMLPSYLIAVVCEPSTFGD